MAKNIRVVFFIALAFGVILSLGTPNSSADRFKLDNKATVTLGRPIEIPGYFGFNESTVADTLMNTFLPKGEYVLEIVDPSPALNLESGRMIVRIVSPDGKRLYATLMAIPDLPSKSDITGVTFYGQSTGNFSALREWIYPSGDLALRFVYPREQAVQIAQESGENVIAADIAAGKPWSMSAEETRDLLEQPLIEIGPDGTEVVPLV